MHGEREFGRRARALGAQSAVGAAEHVAGSPRQGSAAAESASHEVPQRSAFRAKQLRNCDAHPRPQEVVHRPLAGRMGEVLDLRDAALVLGHGNDPLHPFADAKRLARQLPDAKLIKTRTFAELWICPGRLTNEIARFRDRAWAEDRPEDDLSPPPEPRAA